MIIKFFMFILLATSLTSSFADDQKVIESDQLIFAPIAIKKSYKEAQDYCSNLNVNNLNNWRLADTFEELKPMLRADRVMQEWQPKDVSFSINPNSSHFFYCMKDLNKEAKIETEEEKKIKKARLQGYLAKMKPILLKNKDYFGTDKDHSIKELNESQEGLKRNSLDNKKQNIGLDKKVYSKKSNEYDFSIDGSTYDLNPKNLPKCIYIPYDNCFGIINPPGGKYSGEFKSGSYSGFGMLEWENNVIFMGNFNNDKLNGIGRRFVKGKLDFFGEFENGLPKEFLSKNEKIEERNQRVIKESIEYQASLIQTKKRFFKESNLPECTNQNLKNCYASNLKLDAGSYEGELGEVGFEGMGLVLPNNGGAFFGDFKNNEFISGIEIYKNTDDFFRLRDEANQKNIPKEERIKYIFDNFKGEFYIGKFKNNKKEGEGGYFNTINGFSQNGSWKNDQFISGDTHNYGQNNSNQANSNLSAQSKCDGYGFQKGTNPYAQCLMQIDMAQRQANAERQERANRENSCEMAKANAWFQPTRTGNFFESLEFATKTYNNCMAGLPPPKTGLINCNVLGNNVTCFAQ